MKIIFDDIIYWLQKQGGASRYWHELSKSAHKYDLDILHIEREEYTQNPWHIKSYNSMKSSLKLPLKIERYLDCCMNIQTDNKSTIFHSSHYRVPYDKNIVNVVTVYDFTYEKYSKGLAKIIHCWQKKRAIKYADVVICISQYTKNELLYYYPEFSSKIVKIVYLGISDEFFVTKNTIQGRFNNEIIFLGTRNGYKRFDLAIETTVLLSEFKLSIVGGELNDEEIETLNNKIPNRWTYYGKLSDKDLNDLYNTSNCFIFPSDSEGFGLPIIESMKAGCPVVCAGNSVFPEIASDAALFASSQTPQSYADEIIKLQDPECRAQQIKKGFVRAANFTYDKCFIETFEIYKKALILRQSNSVNQKSK
jgi:mannosyltransferase